ncbi:MAG: CDP-alcohol phosphatidyltransferase family protein [Elusimicrobia bacterium]|nr:CDP-alcohol phosphatidyltransferase family protein [Elusimicrobiota bacterium]
MPKTLIVLEQEQNQEPENLKILGLSFSNRIERSARKHGITNIVWQNGSIMESRHSFREQANHQSISRVDFIEQLENGGIIILYPNILFSEPAWEILSKQQCEPETFYVFEDCESCFLIRSSNKVFLEEIFKEKLSFSSSLQKLKEKLIFKTLSMTKKESIYYKSKEDVPQVENWLLQGLIKDTEGFMSKHFERKISLFFSRRLSRTKITPNSMTVISAFIGIGGAYFFMFSEKWYNVFGALFFWLHSVLDGCDGELARLKFLESKFGGILDFWSDNLVHAAIFSGIAYGAYRSHGQLLFLGLGLLAVLGTFFSAGFVFLRTMREKKENGPFFTSVVKENPDQNKNSIVKFADFLARRDFIYLVILFSFIGKIEWFLWMGALGSPIYFFLLLILARKQDLMRA